MWCASGTLVHHINKPIFFASFAALLRHQSEQRCKLC
jgi:hypothetical protein